MNDDKHTMPMAEFKEKFGDTMASMEKHFQQSRAVEAEWFDRNEKLPEEGAIVSLLSYGGRVYQAKKNLRYVGGFEIQNCGGGECSGEHWGRYWTYAHILKPTGTGNW